MAVTAMWAASALAGPAPGQNWIQNGDFEADQPMLWKDARLEREIVHAGNGALRVDLPADQSGVSAAYGSGVEVEQTAPEPMMACFWMRFEAERPTDSLRGGVTFHVDFADGTYLAWYAPFEFQPEEMGSWVYREARWKPRAPVSRVRPYVYLNGCEGFICVDDLYLGPPVELPVVPRATIPLSVTGSSGRFTEWPRFELARFGPVAHVFHLSGTNEANIELTCEVDVRQPAPAYLTSAWGSQYWTLYCPQRAEVAQIYTDERLDLSQPGRHTVSIPMCGFSDMASDLAPGGYVFVTERFKNFLVYSTDKPEGEPYEDPKTGQTRNYWDTVMLDRLSRALGPSGVAAPFSLADLTSYRLSVSAREKGPFVVVRPTLTDADGNTVPLYGLDLTIAAGETVNPEPEIAEDGVPTGAYLWRPAGEKPKMIAVSGEVRLATPEGVKRAQIEGEVAVGPPVPAADRPALPRLGLLGWGSDSYSLSPKASHGPDSMRQLVRDARAAGVRKLLVHARTSKHTTYPSRIVPKSTVGEWDALAVATEEGRKAGVDIYAAYILGIAQDADLEAHPDWSALGPDGEPKGWYCYTNPDVRAFHASLLSEIVTLYPVAGVSLDFCRPGGGCFCSRCAQGFQRKYGKSLNGIETYDPDWQEWQRESITDYMRQLREALRAARPDAKLSGYVWGRLGPDKDRAGQDWPRWLKEGIMDFVAVGVYTPSTPMFRAQCHVLRQIAERELGGATDRIYPMLGVSYIQDANPSYAKADAVIDRHLRAAREEGMLAAGYFPFYSIRTHPETSASHSAFGSDD